MIRGHFEDIHLSTMQLCLCALFVLTCAATPPTLCTYGQQHLQEQRYVSDIRLEKEVFMGMIDNKRSMVVPNDQVGA